MYVRERGREGERGRGGEGERGRGREGERERGREGEGEGEREQAQIEYELSCHSIAEGIRVNFIIHAKWITILSYMY